MRNLWNLGSATGVVLCLTIGTSQAAFAAPPVKDATRTEIEAAIKTLEAALARGDSAAQVSKLLYADDDLMTGGDEVGSTHGAAATVKDVQGWMDSLGPGGAKGCKYTLVDPAVSSAKTFSSFVLLKCKANPPTLPKDQELRMMYIWRKQSDGWKVVLEMYEEGRM